MFNIYKRTWYSECLLKYVTELVQGPKKRFRPTACTRNCAQTFKIFIWASLSHITFCFPLNSYIDSCYLSSHPCISKSTKTTLSLTSRFCCWSGVWINKKWGRWHHQHDWVFLYVQEHYHNFYVLILIQIDWLQSLIVGKNLKLFIRIKCI